MVIEVADAGTHGSELDFSLGAPAADLVGDLDAAIGCAPDVMQAIGESQLLIRTVSRDGLAPSIDETRSTTSGEERKTELERLRNENSALKKGAPSGVRMKVSEKGVVSIYGMGRTPVTLYKEQWLKLLDMSDEIRAFIAATTRS
jgi:hypothetical protein